MNFKHLLLAIFAAGALSAAAEEPADGIATQGGIEADTTETKTSKTGIIAKTKEKLKSIEDKLKFGGYIIGKYSYSDREAQATDGGFDLRFIRLYANGYCFKDFYYRFQLEVNGAPGVDKGPRIVDAFVEWQHWNFFRVKLGQFKRSFGFENPYSPLNVGLGSYSQATMKLASINDRIGEHKSSGRDLGLQFQGDGIKGKKEGHYWLHYQVGVFNGQGINHTDKDHAKDFIGGLWIRPIKTLEIGGFGWIGQYTNESFTNPEKQLKSTDRKRWGAGLKYEDKWTLRSEYMYSYGGVVTDKTRPFHSDAWYVTLGAPIFKNFKVYGRWDCYRDAHTWASLKTDYGLSANYTLGKNLIFQLNYTFTDDRSARNAAKPLDSHYNMLDVQVTARF